MAYSPLLPTGTIPLTGGMRSGMGALSPRREGEGLANSALGSGGLQTASINAGPAAAGGMGVQPHTAGGDDLAQIGSILKGALSGIKSVGDLTKVFERATS